MALTVPDRWIWDFWLVAAGDAVHAFYLQAPRSIGDPHLRHWSSSIGHAVTTDLERWEILPDALAPGPAGSFDDLATWTGSVIEHDGGWRMLYTGAARADGGLVQRVGLATSDDLVRWTRREAPVLELDRRWYAALDADDWHDQAWRDPWLVRDPAGDGFHVYLTARSSAPGDRLGRGVVAHATSPDLERFTVQPPVTEPMGFGQMEVPQVLALDGRWYLLFSTDTGTQDAARRAALTGTGTYYLVGERPEGPFPPSTLRRLEADVAGTTYAGKLFSWRGRLHYVAWQAADPAGGFVGSVADARPVAVRTDGSLALEGADGLARRPA